MKKPIMCCGTTAILLYLYSFSGVQAVYELRVTYVPDAEGTEGDTPASLNPGEKGKLCATFCEDEFYGVTSADNDAKTRYVIIGTDFAKKFKSDKYKAMLDMIHDERNWKVSSIDSRLGQAHFTGLRLHSMYYTAYSKQVGRLGFIKDGQTHYIFNDGYSRCLLIEANSLRYEQ